MPRLIDADKLRTVRSIQSGNFNSIETIQKWIDDAPTVDAVEVVRCKDCIHYWKNNPSDDVPVCLASPKDDAYCSEGERREDAETN